jgi:very-short-patch-repair endonuclease
MKIKVHKKHKSKFELDQLRRKSKTLVLIAEKFRKELIKNQTHAERKFKEYLRLLRIKYEFQKIIYAGRSFYLVDIYLPKYKCVIEIDGGCHRDQVVEDRIREANLILAGIRRIERFSNSEVFNDFVCIDKIKKIVSNPT